MNRLSEVNKELQDDNVEPNSPDYPGLAGLAAVLVENRYLKHKDKEVRLLTVLACMEIFAKVCTCAYKLQSIDNLYLFVESKSIARVECDH